MLDIIHPQINDYIEKQFAEEDRVLGEMAAYGDKKDFPYIGPQAGRILFILARLLKARRIFEMGSGYGYSAYWFAKALPEGGKVFQTEYSGENSKKAREFFERGKLAGRTEWLTGDALELIDKTPGEFDIVFLDLDKEHYPDAFRKAADRIKSGGLLIADNTLWFGKVLEPRPDAETAGIREFTRLLFQDPRFFATIVPIRDGIAVGYKKDGTE